MARRDPTARHRRPAASETEAAAEGTRQRLLDASGEVFAAKGYHAATIKEITDLAGAALGSVNYHFGDKEGLYAELIARIARDAAGLVPPADSLSGEPEARLRQYVTHIVSAMLCRDKPVWERVLMARELAEPSPALDSLIDTVVRPLHGGMASLVAHITGSGVGSQRVALLTCNIVAQCMYYLQHDALLDRVHPQLTNRPSAKRLADVITDFSLAGLQGLG